MRWNIVGAFKRNAPFGTEIAFQKGLERVGETITILDPSYPDMKLDNNPDVTLIFKWLDEGVYREKIKTLPGLKIVYQVDDLRFSHIKDMMKSMLDICDYALTFDDDGATLALQYGYKKAQKLLLTADNQLYKRMSIKDKDIDVSFVGSLSHGYNHRSRMKMLDIVSKLGIRLFVANELFDIGKICEVYNRSHIVLNHATDVGQKFGHGYGYQCRHFEAGFTGACVLSNIIDNDNTIKSIVTFDSELTLINKIKMLLNDVNETKRIGNKLRHELYGSHLPEYRAAELINFVKGLQ